jgi:hypothetical protein
MAAVLAVVAAWLSAGRPAPAGAVVCRDHALLLGEVSWVLRWEPRVAAGFRRALRLARAAFFEAVCRARVLAAVRAERAWASAAGLDNDVEIGRLRDELDVRGAELDLALVEVAERDATIAGLRRRLAGLVPPAVRRRLE